MAIKKTKGDIKEIRRDMEEAQSYAIVGKRGDKGPQGSYNRNLGSWTRGRGVEKPI